VGPRAGMDTVSKRKFPNPRRKSNPDHPARILVAIPAPFETCGKNNTQEQTQME